MRPLLLGLVVVLALPLACGSDPGETFPAPNGDAGGVDGPIITPPTEDGGIVRDDAGPDVTLDTDQDGVPDVFEGEGDDDGDGKPNVNDPVNDGLPRAIKLVPISTNFNNPIGIDYHEPTNSVVLSVNYSTGAPIGFERIELDGTHKPFSDLSGLTEEVKIATVRSGGIGGFTVGDLFVGNGKDGEIVRISGGGATVQNPWVVLPGDQNGLMRGSLYIDRTGVFGGDLIAATTNGEVWRVTSAGVPTRIVKIGDVHLEGLVVVPNKPARFGPLAGRILVGAEEQTLLHSVGADGTFVTYDVGVTVEDLDLNTGRENFFGVDYSNARLLGADPNQWIGMVGDIIIADESIASGTSGLSRLKWDGTKVIAEPIPLTADSAKAAQWEHVTFAAAGIVELAPVVVR